MLKRIIAVLALVLSSGLLAAPLVASANCAGVSAVEMHRGDLVKVASKSTVYFIADNGKRFAFPNAGTYKTWFGNDFSKVKTVSPLQLSQLTMGGYVSYRPGTKLVKFVSSPDVYVVGKNGELRRLANPAVARALFGARWNRMIETMPVRFKAAFNQSLDIVTPDDYQRASQSQPIEISFLTPMFMTVMR